MNWIDKKQIIQRFKIVNETQRKKNFTTMCNFCLQFTLCFLPTKEPGIQRNSTITLQLILTVWFVNWDILPGNISSYYGVWIKHIINISWFILFLTFSS